MISKFLISFNLKDLQTKLTSKTLLISKEKIKNRENEEEKKKWRGKSRNLWAESERAFCNPFRYVRAKPLTAGVERKMIRGGGGSKEGRKHICKITWREKEE